MTHRTGPTLEDVYVCVSEGVTWVRVAHWSLEERVN